jgi:hypothetical protein
MQAIEAPPTQLAANQAAGVAVNASFMHSLQLPYLLVGMTLGNSQLAAVQQHLNRAHNHGKPEAAILQTESGID